MGPWLMRGGYLFAGQNLRLLRPPFPVMETMPPGEDTDPSSAPGFLIVSCALQYYHRYG